MGVNPHNIGPTPKKIKPFDISLFVDVYNAYKKEFGDEFMGKHVSMAALNINTEGQGRLEVCGTLQNLQFLVSLLVMRLASVQVQVVYEQSKGKQVMSMKEAAASMLGNIQKHIDHLEHFDHTFPKKKPDVDGIQHS